LQTRIWGLRQGLHGQPTVDPEFVRSFDFDVQELVSNTAKMNHSINVLVAELKRAISDRESTRGYEATIASLTDDLVIYKERAEIAEKAVTSMALRGEEDTRQIKVCIFISPGYHRTRGSMTDGQPQDLKEKLRENDKARMVSTSHCVRGGDMANGGPWQFLHEQLTGKRNLWLSIHNDPQERALILEALTRSSTPLASGRPSMLPNDLAGCGYGARGPGSVHSNGSSKATSASSSHEHLVSPPLGIAHPGSFRGSAAPFFPPGGGPAPGGPPFAHCSPYQFIPHSHSGPAAYMGHQRRLSNATTTSSLGTSSLSGYASSRNSGGGSSRPSSSGPRRHPRVSTISETGSPKERKRTTNNSNNPGRSLVRPDLDSEHLTWAEEFHSLFALIYGFCSSYFHELPKIDMDWKAHIKAEANGDLWQYMCRICQTTQDQEPGDHALRLLKDRDSRPYLLQRLILQHIVVSIFSFEGWKEYSEEVDAEMERLAQALKAVDCE
jgi:hypothetical protein